MYTISVSDVLDSGHKLDLPYESKCNGLHGHCWKVTVEIQSEGLINGMVVDFIHVKQVLRKYDHKFFLEESSGYNLPGAILLPFAPTAENLAELFFQEVRRAVLGLNPSAEVMSVELWETPSGSVVYTPGGSAT